MAIDEKPALTTALIDKQELQRAVREANVTLGLQRGPVLSAKQVQAMMRAEGICPEDCEFSREMIRLRYAPDEDPPA